MTFRKITGFFFITTLMGVLSAAAIGGTPASAQQESTPTVGPETATIFVSYEEPINVRGGPNSVYYPVLGSLPIGAVAQAIGRSPAGEWIQIVFPEANDGSGVGWVYAALVTLSPGYLPIVEPPPTALPAYRPTLNPDFVASLQPPPTSTPPATFTAPAPLVIPSYDNPAGEKGGPAAGVLVLVLGGLGLIGLTVASFRRA